MNTPNLSLADIVREVFPDDTAACVLYMIYRSNAPRRHPFLYEVVADGEEWSEDALERINAPQRVAQFWYNELDRDDYWGHPEDEEYSGMFLVQDAVEIFDRFEDGITCLHNLFHPVFSEPPIEEAPKIDVNASFRIAEKRGLPQHLDGFNSALEHNAVTSLWASVVQYVCLFLDNNYPHFRAAYEALPSTHKVTAV